MKNIKIKETSGGSFHTGILPYGCLLCMEGKKMVYFMGGDCPNPEHCNWYCPVSNKRKTFQYHFTDEIQIENIDDIDHILDSLIQECNLIGAAGCSFTGGDPLSTPNKVERVVMLIHGLKSEFGEDFHIHLYTTGTNFDYDIAERLDLAGLDALRFHPNKKDFYRIEYATQFNYTVGAEVPCIPTEEYFEYLLDLVDHLENIGADYINLNEFEMNDPNQIELQKRGFTLKENTMATVEGSREFAERLIKTIPKDTHLSIHFCSAAFKDSVQIRNRYKRRAENIKKPFEEVSEDGTLLYMQIQGSVQDIKKIYKELLQISKIPKKMLEIIPNEGKLLLPPFLSEEPKFIEQISEFKVKAGIVEILPFREKEYGLQVEYTPINQEKEVR